MFKTIATTIVLTIAASSANAGFLSNLRDNVLYHGDTKEVYTQKQEAKAVEQMDKDDVNFITQGNKLYVRNAGIVISIAKHSLTGGKAIVMDKILRKFEEKIQLVGTISEADIAGNEFEASLADVQQSFSTEARKEFYEAFEEAGGTSGVILDIQDELISEYEEISKTNNHVNVMYDNQGNQYLEGVNN